MGITYHTEVVQRSDEWYDLRCGILTASEMDLIITPKTLKYVSNDKERKHLYELTAQRITKYVEPSYIGEDMIRGMEDEILARDLYSKKYAPVEICGFITNDKWGFTLGMSPDGLVGADGLIECKSRKQAFQVQTIISDEMPEDFRIQVQTAMLITERKWVDFISYSNGLPMLTKRVYPDKEVQDVIIEAASLFNGKLSNSVKVYDDQLKSATTRLIPTERRTSEEIY